MSPAARLPRRWESRWRSLGWPAAAGLLALLAAALTALLLTPAWQRDAADAATLRSPWPGLAVAAPLPDPAEAWPPRREHDARLRRLVNLASLHGLALSRLVSDAPEITAEGPHWQRVRMPLRGDYPALRAFLADALEGDPALALESLTLRAAEAGSVEAELVWALGQRP